MLNHTYTSVKNANVVDCGKKEKIPSQPFPLLRDNYLGEYRTELDKKKVLANLGIATDLSLEWEYIKGDIGRSEALMKELDSRTKYISEIDGFTKSVIEGIQYLESVVGGEQEAEEEQNKRLTSLETTSKELTDKLDELKTYLEETIEVDINTLEESLKDITEKVNNITELIQVSSKAGNALQLLTSEDVEEGETPGLYVLDLSEEVSAATENIKTLQEDVKNINDSLEDFVTREELGGGDFDFVDSDDFENYVKETDGTLENLQKQLDQTVKTDSDGHVNKLYVNEISNNNNTDNTIKITDSFEMTEGVPLDIRFVVESLDKLHSLEPSVCYAGMGVIVKNQASLYILREPADGIINEEYIRDEENVNWKCPEDLIIEVLTQEEFDQKEKEGSISNHMFYYIHEEVVEEPIRSDYDSDEAYQEALNKWLRVLQQKYMSAVWGQEIEKLVSNKANITQIEGLESEIRRVSDLVNSLSGGDNSINLRDLNTQVQENTSNIDILIQEDGTIPTLQKDLGDFKQTVTSDYVTIESIQDINNNTEYIFVKKQEFNDYKQEHSDSIANSITTKKLTVSEDITIGGNTLTSKEENVFIGENQIALNKDVPVIELIDFEKFEKLTEEEIEEKKDTYLYIYDNDERYLLYSEYDLNQQYQSSQNQVFSDNIRELKSSIGNLPELKTSEKGILVYSINELHDYVSKIDKDLNTLITEEGVVSSMQAAISALESKIADEYVTIDAITKGTPERSYIFVKSQEFSDYKSEIQNAFESNQITTNKVILGGNDLTVTNSELHLGSDKIALNKDVPVIKYLSNDDYKKEDIQDNVYYYIYDDTDIYVLKKELEEYQNNQSNAQNLITSLVTTNKNSIGDLNTLETESKGTLVLAINELVSKIKDLTDQVNSLKEQLDKTETN